MLDFVPCGHCIMFFPVKSAFKISFFRFAGTFPPSGFFDVYGVIVSAGHFLPGDLFFPDSGYYRHFYTIGDLQFFAERTAPAF